VVGVRTRTRTFVALLAAFLLLAPVAEAAKRKVPRGFFGAVYAGEIEDSNNPILQGEAFDRLASAGVESTRVVFNWDLANKVKGVINWSRTDSAVGLAAQHRMPLLATVMYTPPWAKRYKDQVSSPPKDVSDYTDFLVKLIDRYGPKGQFWLLHPELPKRPVRVWQVWNEVDLQFQWYRSANTWKPKDAADYGKLLRASRKTVHEEDPGAKVMLASLAIDSWRILKELYDHGGIRGKFDIAALQAEAGTPGGLSKVMKRFRSVLNHHGAKSIPMWATEFGWPASKNRTPKLTYATGYMTGYATTDKGMASRLRKGYPILVKLRKKLKLQRVFWFTGVSPYRGDFEYDYSGLLRLHNDKFQAKPAYYAYKETARKFEGCPKNENGGCR
jgi:hypothetical protein